MRRLVHSLLANAPISGVSSPIPPLERYRVGFARRLALGPLGLADRDYSEQPIAKISRIRNLESYVS